MQDRNPVEKDTRFEFEAIGSKKEITRVQHSINDALNISFRNGRGDGFVLGVAFASLVIIALHYLHLLF